MWSEGGAVKKCNNNSSKASTSYHHQEGQQALDLFAVRSKVAKKRGLSKFYTTKSQSFASGLCDLGDLCISPFSLGKLRPGASCSGERHWATCRRVWQSLMFCKFPCDPLSVCHPHDPLSPICHPRFACS